jgi:Dolichyl-phosphate-mannose-protein mannosyltransferase
MNNFSLKFNTYYRLGWFEYAVLFTVLFLSFYFGMSTYAIENINEGLYAEIPREMLQIGNYVIPNLNFVPYIEKPPLFYWLIALSYKIFGISEWSARVVPATAAALTCLSLVHFGQSLRRNREGWLAAIILATSIGFIAIARVLIFDMVLTFFFGAALLAFYLWYKSSNNTNYLRLFYLFTGCAFLTKGILAIVLIPAITFTFLLTLPRPGKMLLKALDPLGITLFAMIVVPWHYLAIKAQAGFAWDYFINEQVLRFFNKRVPHDYHTGPIYFYLPKVFLYLLPWSLLSFLFFKPDTRVEKSLYRFLWLWFFIPLIFFSLSRAKGDYYMVISMPPLAMLLALNLNQIFYLKNKKLVYFFALLGGLESIAFGLLYSATIGNCLSAYLPDCFKLDISFIGPLYFLFITASCITIVGSLIFLKFERTPLLHFSGIVSLMFLLIIFYVVDKQKVEYDRSEMHIAKYIEQHDPNRPVYLYKDYEKVSSLLFYLKKRLPLIDSTSQDLYFGSHTSLAKGWFYSLNNFLQARDNEAHYVVARKDNLTEFLHIVAPKQYCVVAQSGSSVLLSNKVKDCGLITAPRTP